jgi:nitroreductase
MDVHEAIRTRRSVRSYRPDPVPDDVLARVLEAVRLAPWGDGGSSRPPTRLVVVRDREARERVAALCHGQTFVATAPLVVIACAPETRSGYSRGGWMGTYSVLIDAAIAVDHLTLAARAEGLGTCWIGSFDNTGLREFLGLPECVNVAAVTPLGYPDGEEFVKSQDRRRLTTEELVQWDRWE